MILMGTEGETDWPVVPWVFLFILFKNGDYVSPFPVSGNFTRLPPLLKHDGQWLSNFICQFSSGPADAPHQVPWTCAPSGSLDGLKPDLLLQWPILHSPSPCLCRL